MELLLHATKAKSKSKPLRGDVNKCCNDIKRVILNLSSSAVRIMKTFSIKGRQPFESICGMSVCKGRNFEA